MPFPRKFLKIKFGTIHFGAYLKQNQGNIVCGFYGSAGFAIRKWVRPAQCESVEVSLYLRLLYNIFWCFKSFVIINKPVNWFILSNLLF